MPLFSSFGRRSSDGPRQLTALTPAAQSILVGRDALEREILRRAASDDQRPVFVVAFGLDRFERLRAVAGHTAVVDIVKRLAGRLGEHQPTWSVAHIADDVLAAVFHAPDEAMAVEWTRQARVAIQGEYNVGDHPIDVRLRAGLSAAGPPNALLREADIALDGAREARLHFSVFDASAHAEAVGALSLMPELRSALQCNQLSLVHQPKRDLRTGVIKGVETLVRWTHPTYGPIAPDLFVRLAEETIDIYTLTRWVIDRAIAEQEALMAAGHVLSFAVNLSGRLVSDADFIEWILDRAPTQTGALRLEITETAVIEHPAEAVANVAKLKQAGIPCSIDDFGSGLASLGYLKRIDADELKLDKSVVDDLSVSTRDRLITRSIVGLAHSLGMSVVAEGVETAESAAAVAAIGCDLAQGYFFAHPMPLASLQELLKSETAPSADRMIG